MSDESLIVVGIAGRARSGKGTAGKALELHRGCVAVALADGVKSALADMGDDILKELAGDYSARWGWQRLGTEARATLASAVDDPAIGAAAMDHWLIHWGIKVAYLARIHPAPRRRIVVPDVRFPYEPPMLRRIAGSLGGRYGTLKLERGGEPIAGSDHDSERLIDRVAADATYRNDGTTVELAEAVLGFYDALAAR